MLPVLGEAAVYIYNTENGGNRSMAETSPCSGQAAELLYPCERSIV